MGRPKKLVVKKLFSDEEIAKKRGTWIEESDIKYPIVNSNTDVYRLDDNGNEILLLKFRKNCINDKLIKIGWDSYKNLAKQVVVEVLLLDLLIQIVIIGKKEI